MLNSLLPSHFDLVTPDGIITTIKPLSEREAVATVFIENISSVFVGFEIPKEDIFFNIKSAIAQFGLDGTGRSYELDKQKGCAEVEVLLKSYGLLGKNLLACITPGAYIGKLFAADERRRVRDPFYLSRMFGRSDRWGRPLLSLGGLHGSDDLILDVVDNRTVAYLALKQGRIGYDDTTLGFIPTLAKALHESLSMRDILRLHQVWQPLATRKVSEDEILLVKTLPLHIRTVFARVVDNLLSSGFRHTSASVLQPDTYDSGDVYELYGENKREIPDIPLEFYTLEPYREHVFFSDRDQLQICLESGQTLFSAFATAEEAEHPKIIDAISSDELKPKSSFETEVLDITKAAMPSEEQAAVFIVKGDQLLNLTAKDWIKSHPLKHDLPGLAQGTRQAIMVERYIEQQPSYPFLKAIDDGLITSQGVLFTKYFPSPFMKRMLLGNQILHHVKGIYFQYPSFSTPSFFSAEDRSLMHDLHQFGIPIYWVDNLTRSILKYVQKPGCDSGLFVPLNAIETFLKATLIGIYGSNLISGTFEEQLRILLEGLLKMRLEVNHPLLNAKTPLALVTGGGPGAMEVGNRVAKELGILSCANIVDFSGKRYSLREQHQNSFIEAKMTYRLDKLVERQAEFNLDLPIFLKGGIGTDFEFALEEVRRKVGAVEPTPMILFGEASYWRQKISSCFQCNKAAGTIAGSEWISNNIFCIQTGEQGLKVYRQYFDNQLILGPKGPIYEEGFVEVI